MALPTSAASAQDSVCARVRVRLSQDVVLSRDAFRATLELNNEGAEPLAQVGVTLEIRDPQGALANLRFSGADDPLVSGGLSAVDGTGTLPVAASGAAQWTLIPLDDAAPTQPLEYAFGGELTYTTSAGTITAPLTPVRLTVHPNPKLTLKYFWQRDVFGDDPLTLHTIEPRQPFSIGAIISNTGYGVANNVRVTSAQPEIISNERGLVIDFNIIGTESHGEAIAPTLKATLGDIGPIDSAENTRVARWLMTSTFSGFFSDFSARMEHIDGLGDPRLSLFESQPEIYSLTHAVRTQEPGDDPVIDFLADAREHPDDPNESDPLDPDADPDRLALPDTLFTSDGRIEPVAVSLDGTADVVGDLMVRVTAPVTSGWNYIKTPNPLESAYQIVRVERADGRELLVGDNAWQTDRIFIGQGRDRLVRHRLHIFDKAGPGEYFLYFEGENAFPAITTWNVLADHGDPAGPASLEAGQFDTLSEPRQGGVSTIRLDFNKPIDSASIRSDALAIAATDALGDPIDLSDTAWSLEPAFDRRSLTIDFDPPLPDQAKLCLRIAGLADHFGNLIGENVERQIITLAGDVTGDARVNNTDVGALRALLGTDPIDPTNPAHVRADVNRDGAIDDADDQLVLAARRLDMRFAGDPCDLIDRQTPSDPPLAERPAPEPWSGRPTIAPPPESDGNTRLGPDAAAAPAAPITADLPANPERPPARDRRAREADPPTFAKEFRDTDTINARDLVRIVDVTWLDDQPEQPQPTRSDDTASLAPIDVPQLGPAFILAGATGSGDVLITPADDPTSPVHLHLEPGYTLSLDDLLARELRFTLRSIESVGDDLTITAAGIVEDQPRRIMIRLEARSPVRGDTNRDSRLDIHDLLTTMSRLGKEDWPSDLDEDGIVTIHDVFIQVDLVRDHRQGATSHLP